MGIVYSANLEKRVIRKTQAAAIRRREGIIFVICFAGAYMLNVIGIIKYHSPVRELVTELHVVLLVTLVIYGSVAILRVLYYLISRFWIK